MDIYNLEKKYKITNLKQGVRNPNRVNIFVDDKFSFSLDVSQVVDLKIKVGQEISEDKLEELKKASEFGKLYQRALEWVLMRPRSEKETKDYLFRKLKASSPDTFASTHRHGRSLNQAPSVGRAWSSEDISEFSNTILERLISKGFLNDLKFAEWYVENRFVKKGISKKRLKMELLRKGVSMGIIDEVLDLRNDEEEIKKIIMKKRNKYDDDKLINYLCRQGFSYQQVHNLVHDFEKD